MNQRNFGFSGGNNPQLDRAALRFALGWLVPFLGAALWMLYVGLRG